MGMGYDLLFNAGTDKVGLMLEPLKNGGRAWAVRRVPQTSPRAENAQFHAQLEWISFHGGAGHGRILSTGAMPMTYADGTADARFAMMTRLPPAVRILDTITGARLILEHAGFLWVVGQVGPTWTLWKVDPIAETILSSYNLGVPGEPFSMTRFDGTMYIGMGFTVPVWKIDAAGSSPVQASVAAWQYATVIRDKMYFNTAVNVVKSVSSGADPMNIANHLSPITVGDTTAITGLSGNGRITFVLREDGLNAFDDSLNLVNLVPDLQQYRDPRNGKGGITWHGVLLIPHIRGLFYYGDGYLAQVGPEINKTNGTYFQGRAVGMSADGEWFWALLQSPPRGEEDFRYVLAVARERSEDTPGEGKLVWHPLYEMVTDFALPTTLTIQTVSAGKLFFPHVGGSVAVLTLPERSSPPLDPRIGEFQPSADLITPILNMSQPMLDKYLLDVEIDATNLSAGRTVTVQYALNPQTHNPVWVDLGVISTTGRTTLPFPGGTTAREVILRYILNTDDTSQTPLLLRAALGYMERTTKRSVITAVARVGKGMMVEGGSEDHQNVEHVITKLEEYEEAGLPQTLRDPLGRTYNVMVLEVAYQELEFPEERRDLSRYQITLTMEKV